MKPDVAAIYQNRFKEKYNASKSSCDKLDRILLEISKILQDINEVYCCEESDQSTLICQSSIDKFYEEEDKFRNCLTMFTKSLFGETHDSDLPRTEKLSFLLHGIPPDSEQYQRLQKESRRLIAAHRIARESEIAAHVEQDSLEAQVKELHSLMFRHKSGISIDPVVAIKTPIVSEREHMAIASRTHTLRAHLERIQHKEIPVLLDELSGRLSVNVEIAQLRLQEARHRFFIHRQEKLLKLLMKQRQWNTALMMLHETERRNLKTLLRILHKLQSEHEVMISKTAQPVFCDLSDKEGPDVRNRSVQKAFQTLGKERIVSVTSDISKKSIRADQSESKTICANIDEYMSQLKRLYGMLTSTDQEGDLSLSYPEVKEMLQEMDAFVKNANVGDSSESFLEGASMKEEQH